MTQVFYFTTFFKGRDSCWVSMHFQILSCRMGWCAVDLAACKLQALFVLTCSIPVATVNKTS
jgi:hypothetical protein